MHILDTVWGMHVEFKILFLRIFHACDLGAYFDDSKQ